MTTEIFNANAWRTCRFGSAADLHTGQLQRQLSSEAVVNLSKATDCSFSTQRSAM